MNSPLLQQQSQSELGQSAIVTAQGADQYPQPTTTPEYPWRRLCTSTLYFAWVGLLGCFIGLLQSWAAYADYQTETACVIDESFSLVRGGYRPWSGNGFFQVTIRMGSLSFSQAKLLDMAWNVVVGRGGQALLIHHTLIVAADFIATSMETRPITYETFSAVFIKQDASFLGIYRLWKDGSFYRAPRSKPSVVFIFFSLLFALLFPTLADAMTGYVGKTEAFIRIHQSDDPSFIKFAEFDVVEFIVHDAWRINMTNNLIVGFGVKYLKGGDPRLTEDYLIHQYKRAEICKTAEFNHTCELSDNLFTCEAILHQENSPIQKLADRLQDALQYGFNGLNNTPSVWNNVTLPPPSLNISWYSGLLLYQRFWYHVAGETFDNLIEEHNPSDLIYTWSNRTYSLDYIRDNGMCQAVTDVYEWGFSYMQLVLTISLLLIWTTGAGLVWLKAHINLPLVEYPNVPTGLRCYLHLNSAIAKGFAAAGIDPGKLTDRELAESVKYDLQGGRVSFKPLVFKFERSLKLFLWESVNKQKLWFLVFLSDLIATCFIFYFRWYSTYWSFLLLSWFCPLAAMLSILAELRRRWILLHLAVAVPVLVSIGCLYLA
ncbi:hypothetical protein QBC44DRAFT_9400 [Cladorrhinum sp. PSN332]|nr:hypothetical protein QBC44DRAFT_9400 [Cladorrhinum sp. PSN332]